MIITINNINYIFESLEESVVKKNNIDYCIYYINSNKMCTFEIDDFNNFLKYSLYLNNIIITDESFDDILNNFFEMINIYDSIYYYAIITNILLNI